MYIYMHMQKRGCGAEQVLASYVISIYMRIQNMFLIYVYKYICGCS